MQVDLIVERFAPSGGVEHVVWQVAHGLRDAGDRVRVLARRAEEATGIEVQRLAAPSFWQPLRFGAFAWRAARAMRRGRPPDVVVHSFCRTLGQDVFHAGGGTHADYMERTYGPAGARVRRLSPRHALQLALDRRIFADPRQRIQCPSRMVARQIRARFGVPEERLTVIHNGVDVARFAPEAQDEGARALRRERRAADRPVWLLAGSGWRRKGLETAIAALARCRERRSVLWVAGADAPGPWRARARRAGVEERVDFLGPRSDLERVYAAADALILPTRYDAFGLVCVEAAAAGRPVLTSSRAGAAEVLGGGARVVADPRDAAAFAEALDALGDPALRRRMGDEGRRRASALDWPRQVEALRRLYAGLRGPG